MCVCWNTKDSLLVVELFLGQGTVWNWLTLTSPVIALYTHVCDGTIFPVKKLEMDLLYWTSEWKDILSKIICVPRVNNRPATVILIGLSSHW